jgi:hypothetical protein
VSREADIEEIQEALEHRAPMARDEVMAAIGLSRDKPSDLDWFNQVKELAVRAGLVRQIGKGASAVLALADKPQETPREQPERRRDSRPSTENRSPQGHGKSTDGE